ncbi:MAG: sigma 54-interacting transcriptional regulator [Deltaproteobacteria bacterium]|nr:sigma 54-interacting transcriptional regulator [Deltaproteobacteria bacterium]
MEKKNLKKDGKNKEALNRVSYHLEERVKELNCLYNISELFERPGASLDEMLQGTVNVIPSAWQYPDITCARITLEKGCYVSPGFIETQWKLLKEFAAGEKEKGILEIYYSEERGPAFYGPFLREEIKLAEVIAEKVSKMVMTKLSEKSLQESEELYRITAQHVSDGLALLLGDRIMFSNRAFVELFVPGAQGFKPDNIRDLIANSAVRFNEDMFPPETGAFPDIERRFITRRVTADGRESWVEGERVSIRFKGSQAILLTLRDCTERVNRENSIKEEAEALRQENIHLKSSMKERYRFRDIIGKSPVMQGVYELILKASLTDNNVTILGESGTGKELVARAIHDLSTRHEKEFVTVNCGAIPENLLESEFFGHKKGSFTGAYSDKMGYLDIADQGTLFLDELGELSLNMQIKLLRAIDGKDYMPVGSNRSKKSDFRVIAATNRNLTELIKDGDMREDFFYRIHVIPIKLPPLRERLEDIPLLVDHFLLLFAGNINRPSIPARVMDSMLNYDWPGNIRELQNVIRRYLSVGTWDFMENAEGVQITEEKSRDITGKTLEEIEKDTIKKALELHRWNRTLASQSLGISRRALFRKIKKYGLT